MFELSHLEFWIKGMMHEFRCIFFLSLMKFYKTGNLAACGGGLHLCYYVIKLMITYLQDFEQYYYKCCIITLPALRF